MEALTRLYRFPDLPNRNVVAYLLEQENLGSYYNIVRNAIEKIPKLEKENNKLRAKELDYYIEKQESEKKLKALEIIKRCPKEVIEEVETYYSFEELYEDWGKMAFIKSKEEFELVREVLGL